MNRGKDSKPHIGIYGRRNNGKSSLINCLAGQDIAIISDQAGTTTDPVKKSFEITGFGPVILIDTAGIDDSGELGQKLSLIHISKLFNSTLNQPWGLIIFSFAFYFITGYLLYASIFAAIGSAVDNETETQQFMLPVTIPIILALMVAIGTMAVSYTHLHKFSSPDISTTPPPRAVCSLFLNIQGSRPRKR